MFQPLRALRNAFSARGFAALAVLPALTAAMHYTVHPGDSLSTIAQRTCHSASDWTGIYAASRSTVGGNPDMIMPGQKLTIACHSSPLPAPEHQNTPVTVSDDTASAQPVQRTYQTPAHTSPAAVTYSGSSGVQACIIARESGGNSQIWNASGHYGLYQFSASTWAASGGSPADFGHASVAEQNQVFASAVAARGYSDWRPYDGC